MSAKEWLTCLFPLTYSQWKYLTEYFAVVLFMPYINLAIKHMTAQQHRTVLLMILGFSVWTTCSFTDPMNLKSGYSVIWIVLLYIAGALVKKTGLDKCVSQECALIGFVLCALLAYGSKVVEVLLDSRLTRLTKGTGFLMSYVSPVVLLCAFFLLIYFSQVKQIPDRWIPGIRWMSSVSFGVFLIHTQIIVRTRLYKDAFIWITTQNTGVFLAVIIVSAIGIYLLCGSVEYLRQRLFSYMRIDNKSQKLYNAVKIRIIRHMNIFFGK